MNLKSLVKLVEESKEPFLRFDLEYSQASKCLYKPLSARCAVPHVAWKSNPKIWAAAGGYLSICSSVCNHAA